MERTTRLESPESVEERDRRLLHAWQGGDADSGGELLRAYQPLFFQLSARRGIRSTEDLLDLQGEMVLELCKGLDRLWVRTGFASCVHWAWKSAVKRFLSGRRRSASSDGFESLAVAPGGLPEAALERDELVAALIDCAESLDTTEFEVFSARVLEKQPYAVIESRLALRAGALRTRYHRAIRKLRDCLASKGMDSSDD